MSDIADKIYTATGLTLNAEAAAKIGRLIQAENEKLRAENAKLAASNHAYLSDYQEARDEIEKLRAALQWLLNDLQDYPASARPIAAYDNALAALGEKE